MAAPSKMVSKFKMEPRMAAPSGMTNLTCPLKIPWLWLLHYLPINPSPSVKVCPPSQHMEPHARPTNVACTTYSSQPCSSRAPLSRSHAADNAPHNTSSAIDNSKGMAQMINQSLRTTLANSPINIDNLAIKLRKYPLRAQAKELEEGFRFGFRLGFIGKRVEQTSKNITSAFDLKSNILEKINKEINKGRVAGPFDKVPLSNFRSSPIGLVPYKLPGDYRLIHHLSWPQGTSVNDQIDPNMCSVKYSCFDDAVSIVQQSGPNNCGLANAT